MSRRKFIPIPQLSEDDIKRFWSMVDRRGPNECWPWAGGTLCAGYGIFRIQSQRFRASRIAFFLSIGIDPEEFGVCHTCDNPPCCNTAHHFLGDQKANMEDAMKKGKVRKGDTHPCTQHPELMRRGEQITQSKLTAVLVKEIRALCESGASYRELGRRFHISDKAVRALNLRITWRHV